VNNKKCERGGRLKVKIRVLFNEDNSRTVAPCEMKFDILKIISASARF
jgi:hypothetical protein